MARLKYKMTAFTRLLLFMIFFAPVAYIGAAYIQGEDGIQKFKELIGVQDSTNQEIDQKQKELDAAKKKVKELEKDLEQARK